MFIIVEGYIMPVWLLYIVKSLASNLLLALAKSIMAELQGRDDNTVNKDAKKVVEILDNNTITHDVVPDVDHIPLDDIQVN